MTATTLTFVSGKGGTGKSAVAAAMAIAAARSGQSVLAIDMGGNPGLGTHLRNTELGYRPVETRPGLWAMTLDRSTALDEYLKLQLRVPQGAPTRQIAAALSVLADTAPGVREIISIGKPIYEAWRGVWDAIVVDAPSLGQFQSYLRAPATIRELVPTGSVRRQASRLAATLADEETTSVRIVTTPAELPVRETNEALRAMELAALCPTPAVIVNRNLEPSGLDAAAIDRLPVGTSIRQAAAMQVTMEVEQATWRTTIAHTRTLPFLRGVLTPEEVAVRLADALESPS
jgi:anion-transporting  ArsA/GET3 family ATPase